MTGRAADGRRWAEAALAGATSPLTPGMARAAVAAAYLAYDCHDLDVAGRWAKAALDRTDLADGNDRCAIALCQYTAGLETGDAEAQRCALTSLRAIAKSDGDPWAKAFALLVEGDIARVRNDLDSALALHSESARLFQAIGDAFALGAARHNQAAVYLRLGKVEAAAALFAEMLELGRGFRGSMLAAYGLAGLAGVAAARHDGLRAARLFGVADRLFAEMGNDLQAPDRQDYDRDVAAARGLLDDHAYAAAWSEGRALDLDTAIAWALGRLSEDAALGFAEKE